MVVMDGIEGLTFHVCAEGGCSRSPTTSMSRFCSEHAHMEVSDFMMLLVVFDLFWKKIAHNYVT